jgi:NAD(P)-dependent dehydrogenase (short-subunit alcohol dehydrogenase family)
VQAAVARFGRVDVLVNNAANFYGGYFEELTLAPIADQLATRLVGPMNITRPLSPLMRRQRSGPIVSISSGAGRSDFEFNSAYSAAKFGLEGWMESCSRRSSLRDRYHRRGSGLPPPRSADRRLRQPRHTYPAS